MKNLLYASALLLALAGFTGCGAIDSIMPDMSMALCSMADPNGNHDYAIQKDGTVFVFGENPKVPVNQGKWEWKIPQQEIEVTLDDSTSFTYDVRAEEFTTEKSIQCEAYHL